MPRREPYLLPPPYAAIAAEAIRERQRLAPYWATLWYDAALSADGLGSPVVAPPWVHFPPAAANGGAIDDEGEASPATAAAQATLAVEGQWMVGTALLVQPVATPNAKSLRVRLPAAGAEALGVSGLGSQTPEAPGEAGAPASSPRAKLVWFSMCEGDAFGAAPLAGGTELSVPTPLGTTPRFQRGGSIIPRRERVRRATLLALADPISLHVAPDAARAAAGSLFLDDGVSAPQAPGTAASLVRFAFTCPKADDVERTEGAEGVGRTEGAAWTACELHATPSVLWGGDGEMPTADAAHLNVQVEAVLLRGVQLSTATAATSPRAQLRLLHPVTGERSIPVPADSPLQLEQLERGLLVRGLEAPLQRAWVLQLQLPTGSLLV